MADRRHITVTVAADVLERLTLLASGFGCSGAEEFARLILEEVGGENVTVAASANLSAENYLAPLIMYGPRSGMSLMCMPKVPFSLDTLRAPVIVTEGEG